MARPIRIEYPGAMYHVMCRGNNGRDIFFGDKGCERFLDTLDEVCVRGGWIVHAYVLMGNHYHLLLETPEAPQFASDAGKGLEAGAKEAEIAVHQLDWDHLLRPLWGQMTRLEKKAYAALEKIEERAALFDKAHTSKRLQQHLAKWEDAITIWLLFLP